MKILGQYARNFIITCIAVAVILPLFSLHAFSNGNTENASISATSVFPYLPVEIGLVLPDDSSVKFMPVLVQNSSMLANSAPILTRERKASTARTYHVIATAYSSTLDQTDDSPFITASGIYVRDGIIAANFLSFGTQIRIPKLYGDKVFVVEDRMNERYAHGRVDLWFPNRIEARQFGVKNVTIEVL